MVAEFSLLAVTATVVSLSDREREDVEEAIASSVSELTQAKTSAVAAGEPAWRKVDTADNLFTGLSKWFGYRTVQEDP